MLASAGSDLENVPAFTDMVTKHAEDRVAIARNRWRVPPTVSFGATRLQSDWFAAFGLWVVPISPICHRVCSKGYISVVTTACPKRL